MASFIDRLFGVPQPAAPAKAVTGPGVVAFEHGVPLTSFSRTPQKMAREAQAVYHHNPWAYLAENSVSGVASGVAFHVEDANGNTIPDTHPVLVPLYRPVVDEDRRRRIKRRPMWQLTLRHGGLCGEAFWYADGGLANVPPRGFIYINPARMWEAQDRAGNLLGWIMDADRPDGRQPVNFGVEEILHFVYDPPDEGHRGIGIAEAAWRKLHLSEASDIHAEKSFRSGGRKPGIITPVDGKVFNEDEYQAIVRELRNVTDSPDAAKKSLIFKAPVDYKDAGIAPSQMQLSELMRAGRDDTLAIWKVSPSQVGITTARGLNSGETQKYEEASTWQNAREPRLTMLREAIQEDYLDQFGFTLVLHLPEFDDQAPLYELADKATNQPLTINERRALLGLPPFEDELLGSTIYLPQTLVPIANPVTDSDEEIDAGGEVKAKLHFDAIRAKVEAAHLPKLRRVLEQTLAEQKADLAGRIERFASHLATVPGDQTVWWNEEREYRRLADALAPVVDAIASEVGSKTSATFFRPAAKASLLERVLEFVRHRSGIRIKGINDTTRSAVREVVQQGVAQGLSPAELAGNIKALGVFDDARAEMIARTETGYALNDGALGTYREFDVRRVFVYDGDADEPCASANGSTWTLSEAESNPLGHPNCTRDFAPVVKAKLEESLMEPTLAGGIHLHLPDSLATKLEMPAPQVTVNVPDFPEIPTPRVTVEAPIVNMPAFPDIPAPVVNVEAPVVNMPEAKATLPQEVIVTSMPKRVHRLLKKGTEITGSLEEDD